MPASEHPALTVAQRRAFSALLRGGRDATGLSLTGAVRAATDVLECRGPSAPEVEVEVDYVRWLESAPAVPLASPHRLSIMLEAYRLRWPQVLEAIEVPPALIYRPALAGDHDLSNVVRVPAREASELDCVRCGWQAASWWLFRDPEPLYCAVCPVCRRRLATLGLELLGLPAGE